MNVYQTILQFIVSGAVVLGATMIAKSFDSKWAGFLVALPSLTILGFMFISFHANALTTQRYLLSALLFMIPAAVYILSLYLLFGKINPIANCFVSLIPFGIVVYIVQKIV